MSLDWRKDAKYRHPNHPACRCGCGELADECAGPRPAPLGSIRYDGEPFYGKGFMPGASVASSTHEEMIRFASSRAKVVLDDRTSATLVGWFRGRARIEYANGRRYTVPHARVVAVLLDTVDDAAGDAAGR